MPERDNDRLESFFKKVSGRPDISFNEADWKKLEARLDAEGTRVSVVRKNRNRVAGASFAALLMVGGIYWVTQLNEPAAKQVKDVTSTEGVENQKPINPSAVSDSQPSTSSNAVTQTEERELIKTDGSSSDRIIKNNTPVRIANTVHTNSRSEGSGRNVMVRSAEKRVEINQVESELQDARTVEAIVPGSIAASSDGINENNTSDNVKSSPAIADKIKQKANNADSVVMGKNDAKVKDAYGSGLTEHRASPRLSLLLSIAPDFSTVAFDYYTDPGQSFGLMLHYHVKNRWSFSTGVVKSFKKYIGDGDDYAPPAGYWRNNTNGIIPETIDGKCNVLEIPVMVQYTIANVGKSRFLVGAGASSYIMLNESYTYNFEQPNPGAKPGWNSKKSSALFFNVINVTAGFEHRVFPGFMMGVEPYLKIPVEGVGWSNLNLYSVGASLTLRYIILNQKNRIAGVHSQGPG